MAISKIILNGVTQMDVTQDTVEADKLLTGYTATGADGEKITGIYSGGGGGGSSWTLLGETTFSFSRTSTSAATISAGFNVGRQIWTPYSLIVIQVRDTAGPRNGYFYGTDAFFWNIFAARGTSGTLSFTYYGAGMTARYSEGQMNLRIGGTTDLYGVYPTDITEQGDITLKGRYHSTYSLTVNGTYKASAYLLSYGGGASNLLGI